MNPWGSIASEEVRCPCAEDNLMFHSELLEWLTEPDVQGNLAFELGGRIEDAWGWRERRFLARTGAHEGRFDASEYR